MSKYFRVSTVDVDTDLLDKLFSLTTQLTTLVKSRLLPVMRSSSNGELRRVLLELEESTTLFYSEVLRLRLVPLAPIFRKLELLAYSTARKLGKEVKVVTSGGDALLDRGIINALVDPLTHIVRNAVDHGIEPPEERIKVGKPKVGLVSIRAKRFGASVMITVEDDGRGIDVKKVITKAIEKGIEVPKDLASITWKDILKILATPGFTTREEASDVSGRGVGMDVVVRNIESIGGRVELYSEVGRGTKVTLVLPGSTAVMRVLVTLIDGIPYVIPLDSVLRIVRIDEILTEELGNEVVTYLDEDSLTTNLVDMHLSNRKRKYVLVLNIDGHKVALQVDKVIRCEDAIVKPLPKVLRSLRTISGIALIEGYDVGFLPNLNYLIEVGTRRSKVLDMN